MAIDERDDREAMDRLDRYLDWWVERPAAAPKDAALDADLTDAIHQFQTLGDRPNPDPKFVTNLEMRIMDAVGLTGSIFPTPQLSPGLNGRVEGRVRGSRSWPAIRPRRAWPLAQLSSAALFVVVLLAAVFVQVREHPGPGSIGDVPMFRGGAARTGEQPGPGPHGIPTTRWTYTTGGKVVSSPSVAGGLLFAGADDGILHALDAKTGIERWQVKLGGAIGAAPAIVDGTLYVGDQAGNLYAFDAATGEQRWHIAVVAADNDVSLFASSPVVVDGAVYVTSGDGASSPAVVDGVVYVGGDSSASVAFKELHAYDAATGAERWRFPDAATGPSLNQDGLYAVDAATGIQRWHFATVHYVRGAPAVADGVAYIGSRDGMLSAVDVTTGVQRWTFKAGNAIYSSPAVVGGVVYVGSLDGLLYALDANTGSELWRAPVGAVRNSSPAVADDAVYVVAAGALVALDTGDGSERWRIAVGEGADSSPVVVGGMVFVGGVTQPAQIAVILALGDNP